MDPRIERIGAALQRHGATLTEVKPLHGGACQENFRVDLQLGGQALRLALRSDAATSLPGSLRRAAEFEVISAAVAAGVKTPTARWLERSLLREGADAYFLDWVPGEAIGRRVVRNPELEQARALLPAQLADTLARLHRVTPQTHTLPFAPPATGPAQHALDDLRAMVDRLPTALPATEYAMRWLTERLPRNEEVVLVHGDFRTGNFMVTPDGLSALLDWEFAHWGSPAEDLSWISVRDWRFNRLDKPIGGFAAREPFYAAYEAASGRTLDRDALLWWEIFGNLRWAVGSVFQGERYLSGEERDLELIAIARRNVEMEFEALRLIKRGTL
ncbi:MAG: phosphotransferase family protein [Myxococcota bacterium]